jgi:NAD(P)H-flavin reductase
MPTHSTAQRPYSSGSLCVAVQILQSLEVGDKVDVKGPIGHFHYTRPGHFMNHKYEGETDRINMIAGGTGITPMFQVMKEILSNPEDETELRLLYANQTEEDILIRQELEALQTAHPERFARSTMSLSP